jgi:serine/threonine protein kinase/tetratricopeptide (TPR) repeat protein
MPIGGRYEQEQLIGQGGMGAIYRARDLQTGQVVAIKHLKPEVVLGDPQILERFAREGEALRKLNHPNIVKVLDTIEQGDNHYIIMDYVEGGSLRDLLDRRGRLSVQEVLNIALDLTDALVRAHRLKIIHRDIKPANVLMREDGTPLLTDFGVARMGDTSAMTATGAIIGTIAYLPPEALLSQKTDERGDMWAFGVMLYEMLAGVRPFDGDNTASVLHNIISLPTPDLFAHRDDVPWTLMGMIYWMLEKEKEKRPASMRLVGALLENILSGAKLPDDWYKSGMPTPTPTETLRAVREYTTSAFAQELGLPSTPQPFTIADFALSQALTDEKPKHQQASRPAPKLHLIRIGLLAVGLSLVLGLLVFVRLLGGPALEVEQGEVVDLSAIAPVQPNEFMVLVAQLEQRSGPVRDAQRLILDDLSATLASSPVSRVRLRAYPGVIRSSAQALQIAEAVGANVMVWGQYDETGADVVFELGSLASYAGELEISRAELEKMANVRLRATLNQRETLFYGPVQVINFTSTFTGKILDIARHMMIAQDIDLPPAPTLSSGAARQIYAFTSNFSANPQASVEALNRLISLDATNAPLYVARSLAYIRVGNIEKALEDINTARRLNSELLIVDQNEVNVQIYYLNNDERTLELLNRLIEARPDDWFNYSLRTFVYFVRADYALVEADALQAIELGADENFPYLGRTAVALREGDLAEAQRLLNEVLVKFPNPQLVPRLLSSTLNEEANRSFIVPLSSAFGYLTLGQWREVIRVTDEAIANQVTIAEIYLTRGLAFCNLDEAQAAEDAYSAGIALDPQFAALYGLRAEVRRQQGDLVGALSDVAQIANLPAFEKLSAYTARILSGELNCKSILQGAGEYSLPR